MINMDHWLLGLGGSDHDFLAVLMRGSDIRTAIEQERLSRRKHSITEWFDDPVRRAIDYCLAAESIAGMEISKVVGSDTLPSRSGREGDAAYAAAFGGAVVAGGWDGYPVLPEPPRAYIYYDNSYPYVISHRVVLNAQSTN